MVKVFREAQPAGREKWPAEFDLEGVPRDYATRTRLQQQLIEGESMSKSLGTNLFAGSQAHDINKPPREAYRYQEYPKMLHHPTLKNQAELKEFKRIELHNSLHPEKPELLPTVSHQFVVVNSKQEEAAALDKGYRLKPPVPEWAKTEKEIAAEPKAEILCDRGCGNPPHRGRCVKARVTSGLTGEAA